MRPSRYLPIWIRQMTEGCSCVVEMGSMFFTRLAQVDPEVKRRIGIEIWEPYIKGAKFHDCEKIHGDMRKFESLLPPDATDCVMFIDSVEHLTKEEGLDLLRRCQQRFGRILAFIPRGTCVQEEDVTGFGAHEAQTHRSSWEAADLEELGYAVRVYNNYHGAGRDALFGVWQYDYRAIYTEVFGRVRRYNRQTGIEGQYGFTYRFFSANRDRIGSVMELGTGRGAVIHLMQTHLKPQTKIIAVDLENYLNGKLVRRPVSFLRCDMTNPEERSVVPTEGVDVIACIGVLEHIRPEHLEDVVQWISTLRPNLGFVFMTANHSNVLCGHELHITQLEGTDWDALMGRYFNVVERDHIEVGGNEVFSYSCEARPPQEAGSP